MNRPLFAVAGLLLTLALIAPAGAGQWWGPNLVGNGGFEKAHRGRVEGWRCRSRRPDRCRVATVTNHARSGARGLVIVHGGANHTGLSQSIPVREGRCYRVSCWVRTIQVARESRGAYIAVRHGATPAPDLCGTNLGGWRHLFLYVRTGPGTTRIELTLGLGGEEAGNRGAAIFDDVSVQQVTQVPVDQVEVLISTPRRAAGKDAGGQMTPRPAMGKGPIRGTRPGGSVSRFRQRLALPHRWPLAPPVEEGDPKHRRTNR